VFGVEKIGNHTQHGNQTIRCNYLTFQGRPEEDPSIPGGVRNPKLPNQWTLTGALVSHFNPSGNPRYYTDARSDGAQANAESQVALDYNAALVNAAAALVALPDVFYRTPCPTIKSMLTELQREQEATRVQAG
jgi:hypothetical protein